MSIVARRVIRSPQQAAERQRRAAAADRAEAALSSLLAGMPADREFAVETLRALIRQAATKVADVASPARALGLLAGAAADVCPAYRDASRTAAAEALFRTSEEA